MSIILRSWAIPVACCVVVWRLASELVARSRELAASGELALRVEARRLRNLSDALARAHEREAARVPVLVGVAGAAPERSRPFAGPAPDMRVHASVQVGAVRDVDVDDVGLLEAAMRRAASERMDVAAAGVRRRAVRQARSAARTDGAHLAAELLAAAPAAVAVEAAAATAPQPRASTPRPTRAAAARRRPDPAPVPAAVTRGPQVPSAPQERPAPQRQRRPSASDWRWLEGDVGVVDCDQPDARALAAASWALPMVLVGALVTFVPLVRPLAEPAPWLAIAGLALVLAGWVGARRA